MIVEPRLANIFKNAMHCKSRHMTYNSWIGVGCFTTILVARVDIVEWEDDRAMNPKGSVRKRQWLYQRSIPEFAQRDWEKNMKMHTTDDPAENRAENFPNRRTIQSCNWLRPATAMWNIMIWGIHCRKQGNIEGESVNKPQIDIKSKTWLFEPGIKTYFSKLPPTALIHLYHCFTSSSKPAA
jgi:hypothetical protein